MSTKFTPMGLRGPALRERSVLQFVELKCSSRRNGVPNYSHE
jgi:hypothetical protein